MRTPNPQLWRLIEAEVEKFLTSSKARATLTGYIFDALTSEPESVVVERAAEAAHENYRQRVPKRVSADGETALGVDPWSCQRGSRYADNLRSDTKAALMAVGRLS